MQGPPHLAQPFLAARLVIFLALFGALGGVGPAAIQPTKWVPTRVDSVADCVERFRAVKRDGETNRVGAAASTFEPSLGEMAALARFYRDNPQAAQANDPKAVAQYSLLRSSAFANHKVGLCVQYAARAIIAEAFPATGPLIADFADTLRSYILAHDFVREALVAVAIEADGDKWSALAPAFRSAIEQAPVAGSTRSPYVGQYVAGAYLLVGRDSAADFIATCVLKSNIEVAATNSRSQALNDSCVPLDSNVPHAKFISHHSGEPALNPTRPGTKYAPFSYDDRLSISIALLKEHSLMHSYLALLAPALLTGQNDRFCTSEPFREAALGGLVAGDDTPPQRYEMMLVLESNFVASNFDADQNALVASNFLRDYRYFSDKLAPDDRSDEELRAVVEAGMIFNKALLRGRYADIFPVDTHKIETLALERQYGASYGAYTFLNARPWLWLPSLTMLLLLAWFVLLLLIPLPIMRLGGMSADLPKSDVPMISKIANIALFLSLVYNKYALDKWCKRYASIGIPDSFLESAREFLPLPASICSADSQSFRETRAFCIDDLRSLSTDGSCRVLISGEGGIGKTTLTSFIADVALHERTESRLFKFRAVPLVISADIDDSLTSGPLLLSAIVLTLRGRIGKRLPVSEPLVRAMLEHGRVLLILDGASEMAADVAKALRTFIVEYKVRSVVITSRTELVGGSLHLARIRPQGVPSAQLAEFVPELSRLHGFTVRTPLAVVISQLQAIGGFDVAPLLVRLYVELSADDKSGSSLFPVVNAAELVRRYLVHLNNKVTDKQKLSEDVLIETARILARVCCIDSRTYTAGAADLVRLKEGGDAIDESKVAYFIDRLSVMRRVGAGADRIRFRIDSVCEYFAGFFLSHIYLQRQDVAMNFLNYPADFTGKLPLLQFTGRVSECLDADILDPGMSPPELDELRRFQAALVEVQIRLTAECGASEFDSDWPARQLKVV
jgi:hypothetical protein